MKVKKAFKFITDENLENEGFGDYVPGFIDEFFQLSFRQIGPHLPLILLILMLPFLMG